MEWHDDLLLGLPEVDEEHREMFESFVELAGACDEGEERTIIMKRVSVLLAHARSHFATEECLMFTYGYPEIEGQRRHHEWFQRDLDDFAARVMQNGPNLELALNIRGKLIRWLIQHIIEVDRRMVDFIKVKQSERHDSAVRPAGCVS